MTMSIKHVSDAAAKAFNKLPLAEKQDFAKALEAVRKGETPALGLKHLTHLDKNTKGVIELIINGSPAYRVVYVAKYNNTVYILHAFTKTTSGVDRKEMAVVVKRYKEIPR
jgi:phage-related protein